MAELDPRWVPQSGAWAGVAGTGFSASSDCTSARPKSSGQVGTCPPTFSGNVTLLVGWVDFLSKYQASNWASRWSRTDCLTPGRAQSKMFFTLDKSKPYKESPWLPSYGIYGLLRRSRIASKMYPLFSIGSEIDEVCEHIYDYFKNQAKAKDLKFLAFFHLFLF